MMAIGKQNYNKKLRFSTGLLTLVAITLMPTNVLAAECVGPDGKVTTTFFDWGCDGNGIQGLLITILNWLAVGVSLAVIGGIIYGAILYTSSGGNAAQSKRAMDIIRNAVIALILYFAMWAAMNWLMPGGMFN